MKTKVFHYTGEFHQDAYLESYINDGYRVHTATPMMDTKGGAGIVYILIKDQKC